MYVIKKVVKNEGIIEQKKCAIELASFLKKNFLKGLYNLKTMVYNLVK